MRESFYYGLATIGAGLVALIVRYAFKSKCNEVTLCYGMVSIQREIALETHDDEGGGEETKKV